MAESADYRICAPGAGRLYELDLTMRLFFVIKMAAAGC